MFMRKYLLAATAVASAIASPGFAAATGPYVGIEGGVVFPRNTDLDVVLNNTTATPPTTPVALPSPSVVWEIVVIVPE